MAEVPQGGQPDPEFTFGQITFEDLAAQQQIRDIAGSKTFNPDTPGNGSPGEQRTSTEIVGGFTVGEAIRLAEWAGVTITDADQYDPNSTLAENFSDTK